MPTPQPFLPPGPLFEYHLEFDLEAGTTDAALVEALGPLWGPGVTGTADPGLVAPPLMPGGANGTVVGFGPAAWDRLAPGRAPAGFGPMEPVHGPSGHVAPATQRDLWVWLHSGRLDVLFDAARAVTRGLAGVARLVFEQDCFPYHNSLSTMGGFIDGTANPGPFDQAEWAVIGDGEPAAGGTTVLLQRWTFTGFEEFAELPIAEQERVFGHEKPSGAELDPQPADSHVGRTTLERNGEEVKIVRRNAYWGTPTETGVMFVGFGADPTIARDMLRRMYGAGGEPGITDRLIEFATAETGSCYLVPSIDDLRSVGVTPPDND